MIQEGWWLGSSKTQRWSLMVIEHRKPRGLVEFHFPSLSAFFSFEIWTESAGVIAVKLKADDAISIFFLTSLRRSLVAIKPVSASQNPISIVSARKNLVTTCDAANFSFRVISQMINSCLWFKHLILNMLKIARLNRETITSIALSDARFGLVRAMPTIDYKIREMALRLFSISLKSTPPQFCSIFFFQDSEGLSAVWIHCWGMVVPGLGVTVSCIS